MAYKLLLADDSITIQKVVELTLSEEDFDVAVFGDGESALDACRRIVPDIVLADVFMPKMDGYVLCGRIKGDPALRHIPVVLLAGTFENFDEARAAGVGADAHVTKPFESAELVSTVKRLAGRRPAPGFLEAEPVEEVLVAEEVVEEAPIDESDDLWSVVDMASQDQPLAAATEVLTEDELWRRVNLASGPDQPALDEEDSMDWDAIPAEPVTEAEEVYEAEMAAEEAETAELYEAEIIEADLAEPAEFIEPVEVARHFDVTEPTDEAEPVEYAELAGAAEFPACEDVSAFERPPAYEPAAGPAAVQAIPVELVREEVRKAVREAVREALSGLSREAIEQVVWEVLPDIAEEIVQKEIDNLKK